MQVLLSTKQISHTRNRYHTHAKFSLGRLVACEGRPCYICDESTGKNWDAVQVRRSLVRSLRPLEGALTQNYLWYDDGTGLTHGRRSLRRHAMLHYSTDHRVRREYSILSGRGQDWRKHQQEGNSGRIRPSTKVGNSAILLSGGNWTRAVKDVNHFTVWRKKSCVGTSCGRCDKERRH
jgi:hypothetical protein